MSDINKEKKRQFTLTSVAVDNATSIFLLTAMILIFGIRAYKDMPKEQYPDASMTQIFINTPYFGNSAEEIENLIARPIEKEISSISGLKKTISTSVQDFSAIVAEFEGDIDVDLAVRKVKDAIDKAKDELPRDLDQEPSVKELDFSELPIMTINISGDYPMDELRSYAEDLQDKVEDISEVSRAEMFGALDREVKINVDLYKMQSLKVSYDDIEGAIARENITLSGGEIVNNDNRRAIRIIGQFDNIDEVRNLIVKSENQRPIYLRDISDVIYGFEERTSYSRSGKLPVISLNIIKRSGENLLTTADEIKVLIEEESKTLPDNLNISLFNDLSVYTRSEVSNLENSIISGVILVVLVLLFFLGLRNALFVGIAIPLSMLTGILILHLFGVIMNVVVLFSLILALGLLVDNGIVVVENIYRYMQDGHNGTAAAKYGAGEVAWPIIASTATTLAAFFPLIFWPGMMGLFMQYMPITLIIVLSSSLFVALVINPVLTSRFMKVDTQSDNAVDKKRILRNVLVGVIIMLICAALAHLTNIDWLRNLLIISAVLSLLNQFLLRPASFGFQNTFLPWLENTYNKFLTFCLRGINGILTIVGTVVLLVAALILFVNFMPKISFFPESDPFYVNIFVDLPIGSDIEATNKIMKDLEEDVQRVIEPYSHIVEAVLTQIGENTSDPNAPPVPGLTPNKARMTVQFLEYKDRGGISTNEIMEAIRTEIKGKPGVTVVVDKNANGPPTGKPVNIELRGDEIDSLLVISDRLMQDIEASGISGIEELKLDIELGKPELQININRESARRYGISTAQIGSAIRTSVFGKEVSKYKVGEDEYPIVVRLDDAFRNNIGSLMNQKITFRNPSNGRIVQVPISSVASIEYTTTYNAIRRIDAKRVITISSNILEGYNANEINKDLLVMMEDYNLPTGYNYAFTGEQQQQSEDTAFLNNAFMIALFCIFIILVTQFNSFISPFIIIISVLFSTIGVLIGYVLTGQEFSILMSGVGLISLAGIVVNNAIVLVDYINLLVKNKRESLNLTNMNDMSKTDVLECIITGGATRLRPVLLTAITTVLGLIPLAIGFNFNFFSFVESWDPKFFIGGDNTAMWGPMGWTIIYGIIFATFLTLVVVPAMYWVAYRAKYRIGALLSKNRS